jgi:hypothetical protein
MGVLLNITLKYIFLNRLHPGLIHAHMLHKSDHCKAVHVLVFKKHTAFIMWPTVGYPKYNELLSGLKLNSQDLKHLLHSVSSVGHELWP